MFCPVFKQTLKQVRANQKIHVLNSSSENFQKLKKHWSSAFQISANTEYKLHVANNTVLGSKVVCCAYHNNEILTQSNINDRSLSLISDFDGIQEFWGIVNLPKEHLLFSFLFPKNIAFRFKFSGIYLHVKRLRKNEYAIDFSNWLLLKPWGVFMNISLKAFSFPLKSCALENNVNF